MTSVSSSNIERVVLYINSSQRTSGTRENFVIDLGSTIQKVQQAEVISLEIPYTFYGLTTNNNTIVWTDNATNTYSATVPPGNYGATSFATALQTAMNTAMAGFTVTYNREFLKFNFQNTTAFRLDLTNTAGTTTMASKIGLTSATALATNVTPAGVIDLAGTRYIFVKSIRLTRPKITRPFNGNVQDDILYKMTVDGSPGDILKEKNAYSNLLKYGVRQSIRTLDLQLVDSEGTQLDLGGLDWSITVNLIVG